MCLYIYIIYYLFVRALYVLLLHAFCTSMFSMTNSVMLCSFPPMCVCISQAISWLSNMQVCLTFALHDEFCVLLFDKLPWFALIGC